MKKLFSKEAIIGLVTVISLFVLYFGINYLKGVNLFKPTNHYYVLMPNVSELQTSSPIYVDGFKVGIVSKIDFGFDSPSNSIVLLISLDEKMKIQTGSYFELKSGLTSGAYLNLVLNKYVGSYYQMGDTIEGVSKNTSFTDQLSNSIIPQVENILPRLDSILIGIQTLVNHPALSQSFNHIEATTASLQRSSAQLNALLSKDIPVIMNDLQKISSNFVTISSDLNQLDLKASLDKIDKVIENIDRLSLQLNDPNSSLGLLLNDRSLYDNLDTTAKNASDLLKDFKEHPKKYLDISIF
jgi:phospholipid/cholesterol/gamma-HCH transport system substrate-binding protein